MAVAGTGAVREKDLRVADTILLYQRDSGGWPKNYDRSATVSDEEMAAVRSGGDRNDATFDNGATYRELAHLARVYHATDKDHYKAAFLHGLPNRSRGQEDGLVRST